MQKYETLFVLQPGLAEERVDEIVATFESAIPENKGVVLKTEKWGKRKLSFNVGRHGEGFYVRYEYEGDGQVQRELERRMKIHEDVIRHLTTRIDPRMEAELARKAERDRRSDYRGGGRGDDRDDRPRERSRDRDRDRDERRGSDDRPRESGDKGGDRS